MSKREKQEKVNHQQTVDVSDQRAPLLTHVRGQRREVGGSCVVLFVITRRGRRVLHHHKPDGRLLLRGRGLGNVLLGRVFAAAVVQNARNKKDQKQDDVAGDEDDEV